MYRGIFDSHAHYDDERYDEDREKVLSDLPSQGVSEICNVACSVESSLQSIALANRFPFVYCSVGIHPHCAETLDDAAIFKLAELSKGKKVKAIGEIGLDYHYDFSPRPVQKEAFRRQLELSLELKLPVIIHNREAHEDTLALLKKYRPNGIVHCFSGSAELATELVNLGLFIGFTGVITFKGARKTIGAAQAVPLDRLLLETDCPYMAPEPYRGKRCDSSMIPMTAEAIASLKGVTPQELIDQARLNALQAYCIR